MLVLFSVLINLVEISKVLLYQRYLYPTVCFANLDEHEPHSILSFFCLTSPAPFSVFPLTIYSHPRRREEAVPSLSFPFSVIPRNVKDYVRRKAARRAAPPTGSFIHTSVWVLHESIVT